MSTVLCNNESTVLCKCSVLYVRYCYLLLHNIVLHIVVHAVPCNASHCAIVWRLDRQRAFTWGVLLRTLLFWIETVSVSTRGAPAHSPPPMSLFVCGASHRNLWKDESLIGSQPVNPQFLAPQSTVLYCSTALCVRKVGCNRCSFGEATETTTLINMQNY